MTGLRALVEAVREARAKYDERRKFDSNGMASERWRLEVIMRERALATALLSTPDVLAAVEAVVALGEWRATEPQFEPDYEIRDRLDAIADRLAARKGE